ncbi:MAG: carbohydrate-binding protein, partial [Desulfobacteraceae bacterium]
ASGGQWDLVVQAQFCAAITRHVIDLNAASGVQQDWGTVSNYYQTTPYNWYAKFWHQTDISYEGQTYAFCYDDVFDQSSTIHTATPTNVTVTIGGFAGESDSTSTDSTDSSSTDSDATSATTLLEAESFTLMQGVDVETCEEGGQNVGWIDTGDWIVWDVDIPSDGTYTVQYRVASLNGGGIIQFENAGGDPVYGTIDVPATGAWQTWLTIQHSATLSAGQQQVAIYAPAGGYNINWIQLTRAD